MRSINFINKFRRLTYGSAFFLNYSYSVFILCIIRSLSSKVLMFSVSPYIPQMVLDVCKMHVAVHVQRTAMISDLTEVGAIPVNIENIGDIKFMNIR